MCAKHPRTGGSLGFREDVPSIILGFGGVNPVSMAPILWSTAYSGSGDGTGLWQSPRARGVGDTVLQGPLSEAWAGGGCRDRARCRELSRGCRRRSTDRRNRM